MNPPAAPGRGVLWLLRADAAFTFPLAAGPVLFVYSQGFGLGPGDYTSLLANGSLAMP
jgi:hypothetical protein